MSEIVRLATTAMGTRFEAVVRDRDPARARAAGEAALDEIGYWHDRLSIFNRASFLSFINAHAHERAIGLDAELFALLSLCLDVWAASAGVFDPTIAPEMVRRGLHDRAGDGIGRVGFGSVVLDERTRTVRFLHEGVSLDLGGVAKGFALDRAAAVLREAGVGSAFVHGGTSSGVAIGGSDDRGGVWRVAMGDEADAPRVSLEDSAYSVSAPTGRVVDGEHHILDPRGTRQHGVVPMDRAGAVWGGIDHGCAADMTAALCDAWSTALVVLGQRPGGMPMTLGSAVRERGVWHKHTSMMVHRAGAGAA